MLDFSGEKARRERPEAAIERLNRELRAVTSCHQTLMRAVDEPNLLAEICRIVCEEAGYRMAWVGYVERDAERSVRPVARAGHDFGYVDAARITWADVERGRGPIGAAIRTGKVVWVQDYEFDPRVAPWRDEALERGFRAGVALPLKDEAGGVFGALSIYAGERDAFTAEEVRLLERLAADLAFGILVLRQREARKRIEALLQANLRFFEGMDRVNQAIQETTDLDAMMGRVLELALALFDCDRAWLLYPCDPEAPSWSVRMERARLEFAAARRRRARSRIADDPGRARHARRRCWPRPARSPSPPAPSGRSPRPRAPRFGVQSQLAMAIHPKTAKAYAFGLHQCGRARVWTDDDQRLFEAIGRRLEDALSSQLAHLELRERESQLRTLFRTIPDLVWVKDLDGRYMRCNPQFERVFGVAPDGGDRQDRLRIRRRASSPTAIAPATGERSRPARSSRRRSRRSRPDGRRQPVRGAQGAAARREPARRSAWSGSPATSRSAARSTSSFASPPPRSRRRRASSSSTPTSGSCASIAPSSR